MERKTVGQLIEELQKFDTKTPIWQVYDPPWGCWPAEVEVCDKDFAEMFEDQGMKENDLMFKCG